MDYHAVFVEGRKPSNLLEVGIPLTPVTDAVRGGWRGWLVALGGEVPEGPSTLDDLAAREVRMVVRRRAKVAKCAMQLTVRRVR